MQLQLDGTGTPASDSGGTAGRLTVKSSIGRRLTREPLFGRVEQRTDE